MPEYKTPGVFIEEIPQLPASILSVTTAIPAFIGYTEKAQLKEPADLQNKPWRIRSMLEYEQYFGYPDPEKGSITIAFTNTGPGVEADARIDESLRSKFLMYYNMQMFFFNGGGPCWITSVGNYTGGTVSRKNLEDGLEEIAKINEVTLLLFPDAVNLTTATDYYDLYSAAIRQAAKLQDRFVIMDVYHDAANNSMWDRDINGTGGRGGLRNMIAGTTSDLKYAAAYFPKIYTKVDFNYKVRGDQLKDDDASIPVSGGPAGVQTLADLKEINATQYMIAKTAIKNIEMLLPASPAIAGIYADVDKTRGVWKAPANVNIANATRPEYLITDSQQQDLNVDVVSGRSINGFRKFEGRGPAIIWGARTLAGNDNEWRYIAVRRFFNMVEESIKKATEHFVFEPNDTTTWVRVRSMIENYLTLQWRSGALMGAKTEEAFYVRVGAGETMTIQDITEGRMIVEVGLAAVRPAEFIVVRFIQQMMQGA